MVSNADLPSDIETKICVGVNFDCGTRIPKRLRIKNLKQCSSLVNWCNKWINPSFIRKRIQEASLWVHAMEDETTQPTQVTLDLEHIKETGKEENVPLGDLFTDKVASLMKHRDIDTVLNDQQRM